MRIGAATVENGPKASQKLKIELSYDPSISLLGTYLKKKKKETKTLIQKDTCTAVFIAILFMVAKI